MQEVPELLQMMTYRIWKMFQKIQTFFTEEDFANYSSDELLSTLPRRFVAGGRSILLYFQFAEFALKISIFGKGENDLCLINIQDIKKETIMGQFFKCLIFTHTRTFL